MLRVGALLLIIGIGFAPPAWAEALIFSNPPQPVFVGGEIQGCTFDFYGLRDDPEYSGGMRVMISGSISVYVFPGREPILGVKFGVAPYSEEGSPAYEAPTQVVLIDGYESNVAETAMHRPGENPGFSLTSFYLLRPRTAESLNRSMTTGRFDIGYAMRQSGTNALVNIDVGIRGPDGHREEGAATAWRDCVGALLARTAVH